MNMKNNTWLYLVAGAIGVMVCVAIGAGAWIYIERPAFITSFFGDTPVQASSKPDILWAQVEISKPIAVSLDASAFTESESVATVVPATLDASALVDEQTPSPVDIPTLTPSPEFTFTPEASETPAQLSMEIIQNTPTREYVAPTYSAPKQNYASSGNGARWIDVDLSNQRVYAYEGDVMVNSFIVSTGVSATPTVTGQYNIYVKYASARMSGPGYSLPNVPYIMYFYGSYGLHGTYWHNNFGTPMSHGCVNLRTDDAAWLYNWASIGTLVNIHY